MSTLKKFTSCQLELESATMRRPKFRKGSVNATYIGSGFLQEIAGYQIYGQTPLVIGNAYSTHIVD